MVCCDTNPNILRWASEELAIPYVSQVDNKWHRYYVDFLVKTNNKTYLVEIKPKKQCQPPTKGKKRQKTYLLEYQIWQTNESKWAAAKEYAEKRGWEFMIVTEDFNAIKL